MVGIPDGLGAFDNGDGTLHRAHEPRAARATAGIVRAHGASGRLRLEVDDRRRARSSVLHGEDLIQQVATWNAAAGTYNAPAKGIAFSRLCSADLPEPSAFYDAASGPRLRRPPLHERRGERRRGPRVRPRLDGHELGAARRSASSRGRTASPTRPPAPRPSSSGLDDSTPGQVYVYVGQKTVGRHPVERAGLTGGTLYGVKVTGLRRRSPARPGFRPARRSRSRASATARTRPAPRSRPTATRPASRGSSVRRTAPGIRTIRAASTS